VVALAQVAHGLQAAGLANGEVSRLIAEPRLWDEQVAGIRGQLAKHADGVILLIDGADRWIGKVSESTEHFADRIREVISLLEEQVPCYRVVTSTRSMRAGGRRHRLKAETDAVGFLSDEREWGPLAGFARQLCDQAWDDLTRYSAPHLRLMVGLVAVSGDLRALDDVQTPGDFPGHFASALQRGGMSRLCDVWARIAKVRGPFDERVLELAGTGELDLFAQDLLRWCLVTRRDGQWVLHETLRGQPLRHASGGEYRPWLKDDAEAQWHGTLADYYRGRFSPVAVLVTLPDGTFLDEIEAFHHASLARRPSCMDELRVFFSDQLNLLGRSLSIAGDYITAVRVFERVIAWDEDDDYAHHYLAYNLELAYTRDLLKPEPERVEMHYQRAIGLAPERVWWWSRWICFLITLGRTREAQAQWHQAIAALGLPNADADLSVYFHLHSWVARLLLHRGQLDFAERVLDSIPTRAVADDDGQLLIPMKRHLRVLLAARKHGAVFPASIDPDRWWLGPHLNSARTPGGKPLVSWMPARVEGVDPGGAHLYVAEPPRNHEEEPTFWDTTLSIEDFNRWSLDERAENLPTGRFIELGFYGEGSQDVVIRVHPDVPLQDLRTVYPDPARYLRRDELVG
jgi:tetratricopeptide (TPR) repeat protein